MKNTIVVFGDGNVGKTTLMGYLYVSTLSPEEYNKKIKCAQEKFGKYYRSEERYSYIISDLNERKDFGEANTGNTKTIHFHPYGDFVLIDTPGNQHAQSQKDLGMFLGDYGIFVVDAQKFLNEDIGLSDFSQLFLWCTLKKVENVVVVLSKIDLLEEEQIERAYTNAKKIINQEAKLNLEIIPIMIDREETSFRDQNVIHERKFNFCKPVVLEKYIKSWINIESHNKQEKNFCIYAERYFDHAQKKGGGTGRTWRNRILSGDIDKNAEVKILPVKYKQQYTDATAKIKTIKNLNNIEVNSAKEGEMIGLDFTNIKIKGDRVQKSEIVSTRGTIIVDKNTKVNQGNTFVLILDKENSEASLFEIERMEEVYMYWFGKRVPVKMIHRKQTKNYIEMVMYQQDIQLVMPLIHDSYLYKKITIDCIRAKHIDHKYFNMQLKSIGNIESININNVTDIERCILHLKKHIIKDIQYIPNYENESVKINLECLENKLSVIKDTFCAINNENIECDVEFDIRPKSK